MNKEDVVKIMKSSKSEAEWNDNCDKVIKSCNGYPDFWYHTIILSGIHSEVSGKWQT